MNTVLNSEAQTNESASNLRATFEILAYILVDAKNDGHSELAERLEFAMNWVERKISERKSIQTVPPINIDSP